MSGNMVSLRDYEGIQGFGMSSAQDVENLNKALSAGTQNPPTSGGNVLRVESLEATLRVVTTTLGHIQFWKMVPKLPAFSTVEEYNRLTDYGAEAGAFTNEGDLPETQDSTYERKTALVKFLGTTREVTHPMTLVRPAHGNAIGLETQNGAIWLVQQLEKALHFGRSDMISQEFDGLSKQIMDGCSVANPNTDLYTATDTLQSAANTIIIDKRGEKILENDLETATNYIVQNYGIPTDLMLAPQAHSDISKQFYPRERLNLPFPVEGKVGLAIKAFESNAGPINFKPNIFLRSGASRGGVGGIKTVPSVASSSKAPNAPTIAAGAPGADGASMFKAGGVEIGVHQYYATAVNRFGESAPSAVASPTLAAGQSVAITITDGGGANAATAYRIYRTVKGGDAAALSSICTTVARSGGGAVYTDRNWFIPATSQAFMVQNNMQNYAVRQLAPMMKIPLATVAASIRWMQLIYLTYILYTPRKNVLFINVADS